jgi:hypothetical protein
MTQQVIVAYLKYPSNYSNFNLTPKVYFFGDIADQQIPWMLPNFKVYLYVFMNI